MAIYIDNTGIHGDTLQDIVTRKQNEKKALYGNDIVLDQNSPDGEEINILAQAEFDTQDVIKTIYNNTTVNGAEEIYLDRLCESTALVYRLQGSKTVVDIEITTDRDNVSLSGSDSNSAEIFTIADSAGNNFLLNTSVTLGPAGTTSLTFTAENVGLINTLPNTLTVIKTPVVGVTAANNPTSETVTGTDRETDDQLRARRALRVSAPANGYLNGLQGKLLSLDGVSSTVVQENDTDFVDAKGLAPHSIRVIMEGGDDQDIGRTIVESKTAGCGTNGEEEVEVLLDSGDIRLIKFDRSQPLPLSIRLNLLSGNEKQSLVEQACLDVKFTLNETANVQKFYQAVSAIDGVVASNIDISINGTNWFNTIAPTTDKDVFISTTVIFIS